MTEIEHEFQIRDVTDSPTYYLGNDIKRVNSRLHVSSAKYVQEMLRKYQDDHGVLKKYPTPMQTGTHPEEDDSSLLELPQIREYQHIIGVCQWLIVAGRFVLCYSVSSLSRFCAYPRTGHLAAARQILGYLKKFPKRGYIVNPDPPTFASEYQDVAIKINFGHQYSYFREDIDPRFPPPLMAELPINIFVDADHAHDKVTGRSITGLFTFIGSTPATWGAKRQTAVATSTFSAEFMALKRAVEESVTLRYHLRSMGIQVTTPTPIWVDNMSVVLNVTNPASSLNKKWVALSYHYVREHQANNVVSIRKIASSDNYSDPMTKALTSADHHGFFYNVLQN